MVGRSSYFIMGLQILVRHGLYIEMPPWSLSIISNLMGRLGVCIDCELTWNYHVQNLYTLLHNADLHNCFIYCNEPRLLGNLVVRWLPF